MEINYFAEAYLAMDDIIHAVVVLEEELPKDVVVTTVIERESAPSIRARVLKQRLPWNCEIGLCSDRERVVWHEIVKLAGIRTVAVFIVAEYCLV